jgi:hypothetical protein
VQQAQAIASLDNPRNSKKKTIDKPVPAITKNLTPVHGKIDILNARRASAIFCQVPD